MKLFLIALAFIGQALSLLLQRLGRDRQSPSMQNWATAVSSLALLAQTLAVLVA